MKRTPRYLKQPLWSGEKHTNGVRQRMHIITLHAAILLLSHFLLKRPELRGRTRLL